MLHGIVGCSNIEKSLTRPGIAYGEIAIKLLIRRIGGQRELHLGMRDACLIGKNLP